MSTNANDLMLQAMNDAWRELFPFRPPGVAVKKPVGATHRPLPLVRLTSRMQVPANPRLLVAPLHPVATFVIEAALRRMVAGTS